MMPALTLHFPQTGLRVYSGELEVGRRPFLTFGVMLTIDRCQGFRTRRQCLRSIHVSCTTLFAGRPGLLLRLLRRALHHRDLCRHRGQDRHLLGRRPKPVLGDVRHAQSPCYHGRRAPRAIEMGNAAEVLRDATDLTDRPQRPHRDDYARCRSSLSVQLPKEHRRHGSREHQPSRRLRHVGEGIFRELGGP